MILQALIIDDEPLAIELLNTLLKDIPTIKVIGQTTEGDKALSLVEVLNPDVVFLDINLGRVSGIDIAEQIYLSHPHVQIVFVTAYTDHAVTAFELNAIDYLLKPVSITRLKKTISKLEIGYALFQNKNKNFSKSQIPSNFLNIFAFQQGRVLDKNNQLIKFRTRKVEELLLFLWQEKNFPPTREKILEALWPNLNEEKASTLFHSTLYQLRKTLAEYHFVQPIQLLNQTYHLNIDTISDVEQWQKLIMEPLSSTRVRESIELYTDDYLKCNSFSWSLTKQQLYKEKWSQYAIDCLNTTYLPKTVLNELIAQFKEDDLFHYDWVLALLNYYGRTKQMLHLTQTYKQTKKIWNQELGLDLPQSIVVTYSKWIQSN